MLRSFSSWVAPAVCALTLASCAGSSDPPADDAPTVDAATAEEAGRYLVLLGGCNDCHTPGWAESNGKLPEQEWLVGNGVGYRGPWGTSYAVNLRLATMGLSDRAWVELFRKGEGPPPMPWQNYRTANERDLLAILRFIRSLGPKGAPAPALVPPGHEPSTPYVDFTPKKPGP